MQTQMTDIDMQESDTSDRILKNKINKKRNQCAGKRQACYKKKMRKKDIDSQDTNESILQ